MIASQPFKFSVIAIHHRSFRYVDRIDWSIKFITHMTRAHSTHVFLSSDMARRYQDKYGKVDNIVAGNATFVLQEANKATAARMKGPLRIGHLSNLCREKGFFDVVDTYETFMKSGLDAELHLAGPVVESEVANKLAALKRSYGASVQHIGPVSGERKTEFYRMLDVFVFPSRYSNEAAPNVVYEALAAGTPVVTTGRGCLPEMVHGSRGIIAEPIERFPQLALDYMSQLSLDDAEALKRRATIKADVAAEGERAVAQHEALLAILLGR
jgi:glycosyltransferase involved in cell wall biosynthesis